MVVNNRLLVISFMFLFLFIGCVENPITPELSPPPGPSDVGTGNSPIIASLQIKAYDDHSITYSVSYNFTDGEGEWIELTSGLAVTTYNFNLNLKETRPIRVKIIATCSQGQTVELLSESEVIIPISQEGTGDIGTQWHFGGHFVLTESKIKLRGMHG